MSSEYDPDLACAVLVARRLFNFNSIRRVDATNIRLGRYWLGLSADESEWCIWRCSRGSVEEPDGALLEDFETANEAMSALVGYYASDCFDDAVRLNPVALG